MAEISNAGYQSIRDYIQSNWQYIELRDETNSPILRISTNDNRVQWSHDVGSQTLELTCIIKGDDADITKPVTFASSAIYDVVTGGSPYAVENFTPFTMENDADQLIIKHQIQVPQLV